MPSAIPLVLAHQRFASQTQARQHFSDMLNRYEPGQTLNAPDAIDVSDLIQRHPAFGISVPADIHHIDVTKTGFGRHCFQAVHPDKSTHKLSFVTCLRHCRDEAREVDIDRCVAPPAATAPSVMATPKKKKPAPKSAVPAQSPNDAQASPAVEPTPAQETAPSQQTGQSTKAVQ